MKTMFDGWLEMCHDSTTYRAKFKKDFVTDVVIQQLNEQDVPIYGIRLENAFPTGVAGIALDNNSESTIQKLSVTFAYDNYIPEGPLSSTVSALRSAIPVWIYIYLGEYNGFTKMIHAIWLNVYHQQDKE